MGFDSDIQKLSKKELVELRDNLQSYKKLFAISRKKAYAWYRLCISGSKRQEIQHFGPIDASMKRMLTARYKKLFGIKRSKISYIRNDVLGGGVRMFLGDDIIEVSMQDFERSILDV